MALPDEGNDDHSYGEDYDGEYAVQDGRDGEDGTVRGKGDDYGHPEMVEREGKEGGREVEDERDAEDPEGDLGPFRGVSHDDRSQIAEGVERFVDEFPEEREKGQEYGF